MATLFPVAGSDIAISQASKPTGDTDWTASDFSGIVWVPIDGWTQMGVVGDMAEIIRTPLINRDRVVKQKGTRDAGSMENIFAALLTDEGQQKLIQVDGFKSDYAFRIRWADDNPDISGSSRTTMYFTGLVNGSRFGGGDANTVQTLRATIEINSNIVVVPAATE